jgi:hypothetical protein
MKLRYFLLTILPLFDLPAFSQRSAHENWQNGDIIFIKNTQMSRSQSSSEDDKFNCAGIIFRDNNELFVYYASEPLKKVPLQDFIGFSKDRKYSVKWLMESSLLNEDALKTMKTYANAKVGTPYDNDESLNTENVYNAEFIWKIYKNSLGINLCEPHLKELTASGDNNSKFDPGKDKSPLLAKKFVSVMDIYRSELLE